MENHFLTEYDGITIDREASQISGQLAVKGIRTAIDMSDPMIQNIDEIHLNENYKKVVQIEWRNGCQRLLVNVTFEEVMGKRIQAIKAVLGIK